MLNLAEYRPHPDRLADRLPWALLVAPGIVLNKDGSFQKSFRFRGPDLESATQAELVSASARLNNILRRFGSGWALFFEAERFEAPDYPASEFPEAASWLVDEERRQAFQGEGSEPVASQAAFRSREHYENRTTLTLLYMPPADVTSGAERALLEHDGESERNWRQELQSFETECLRAFDLLRGIVPEVRPLDDSGTLTYLHGTISSKRQTVAASETPLYLDATLPDEPLSGGIEPMLGDRHLRVLTVLGFPNMTRPGILDRLNHLDFPYRWMTRFIALDKTEATRELTRLRRQWFNKRKSIAALMREVLYNEPVQLLDSDADNKVVDADLALQALGSDHVGFGYLTTVVIVCDEDRSRADDKLRAVERVIHGAGFTTIRETINATEAWLGSLPGHVYANVRQPLVHTLNLSHLVPLSSVWAGPEGDAHLNGPPLFLAVTSGSTPFRFALHVGDVGHTLIVGPTGAGKSVLLALMALQFRRYPGSQITIFDKGNSARAAVLAMGGAHHNLGSDGSLAFQPLARIDDPAERSWASEWLVGLLAHEKVPVTPELKETLWSALGNLASAPQRERTMTGLSMLLQSNALKSALQPYTLEGPFGRLLDADNDDLALRDVQCFETETLMHETHAVMPVLTYLFHRLEERFGSLSPTGSGSRPSLLVLDEAWVFLDDPLFAARIREWLKTLRKKNVSVVFATQSLADITGSAIAPAIVESCPQRIFLPNDRAIESQAREAYERFGLNERQIELIARATPKRHYYLQSRRGNCLFELGLGPIALAISGASDPASQTLIDQVLTEHGSEAFAAEFLRARDLDWAASLLAGFSPPSKESSP